MKKNILSIEDLDSILSKCLILRNLLTEMEIKEQELKTRLQLLNDFNVERDEYNKIKKEFEIRKKEIDNEILSLKKIILNI